MKDSNRLKNHSQDFSKTLSQAFTKANYTKGTDRRPKERPFTVSPKTLLLDKNLSDNAYRIYEVISQYTGDKEGRASNIRVKKVAQALGKSEPTVYRGLSELRDRGLIERTSKGPLAGETKLFEPLAENELETLFFQDYSQKFYKGLSLAPPVFDVEGGEVKAKYLDVGEGFTYEDVINIASGEKQEQEGENARPIKNERSISKDLSNMIGQANAPENPSQQGKEAEIGGVNKKSSTTFKKSVLNRDTHKSPKVDLFASVTNEDLKTTNDSNYNVNQLIGYLQQQALTESVVFDVNKGGGAGKMRGQMSDLRDDLGGAKEVVAYIDWFFESKSRKRTLRNTPDLHKFTKLKQYTSTYLSELEKERKERKEERKDKRKNLIDEIRIKNRWDEKPEEEQEKLKNFLRTLSLEELRELKERPKDRLEEQLSESEATAGVS